VAILSFGARLSEAMKAADELGAHGVTATVADARFAKPLDEELIERLAAAHEMVITIEEGSSGGFGAAVLNHLAKRGVLDNGLKVRAMTLPDRFQDHDRPERQYAEAGLDARAIVETALEALRANAPAFVGKIA